MRRRPSTSSLPRFRPRHRTRTRRSSPTRSGNGLGPRNRSGKNRFESGSHGGRRSDGQPRGSGREPTLNSWCSTRRNRRGCSSRTPLRCRATSGRSSPSISLTPDATLVEEFARRGSAVRRVLSDLEVSDETRAELEVAGRGSLEVRALLSRRGLFSVDPATVVARRAPPDHRHACRGARCHGRSRRSRSSTGDRSTGRSRVRPARGRRVPGLRPGPARSRR